MAKVKQKTHSGTKDRVRITKSGKVLRRNAGKSHLLQKKSAARKRRLNTPTEVEGQHTVNAKRQLGIK